MVDFIEDILKVQNQNLSVYFLLVIPLIMFSVGLVECMCLDPNCVFGMMFSSPVFSIRV